MLVDHLFQYRISPWPKTAEKRGLCTGVTDGPTDRRTDRPFYRDAFLTAASKKGLMREIPSESRSNGFSADQLSSDQFRGKILRT